MPRRGKGSKVPVDTDGAPNRVPTVDAPQPEHGLRQELVEAQGAAPPGRNPLTGPPPSSPQGVPPVDPDEQAIQAALQGLPPGGPLNAPPPDQRPITSGVRGGAGPGPEALRPPRQSAADQIERLALMYDDPGLLELARTAKRRGL